MSAATADGPAASAAAAAAAAAAATACLRIVFLSASLRIGDCSLTA